MTPATGSEIALDTNQVIAVLNDRGDAGTWIQAFLRICIPAPVVGELRFGALNSGKPEANERKIDAFLARCSVLPVTAETGAVYAQIRHSLKRKGTPIPENDLWIAASAVEHGLTLVTGDDHFDVIEELVVVKRQVSAN